MGSEIKEKVRLFELDALRGIAALSVLFFHYTMREEIAGDSHNLFSFGVTAVDLFFMISGFVIFLTLSNVRRWQDFVLNRLIRLYPAYWIAVSLAAILILIDINNVGRRENLFIAYLVNLSMFQSYFGIADLDGPYWTLIIEMLFYITILIVFLVRKMNRIEILGFGALIGVILYDTMLPKLSGHFYFYLKHYFSLVNHFPFFFAGILFYKIKFEGITIARFLGLILCYFTALMLFDNGGRSNEYLNISYYAILVFGYFLIWVIYLIGKLKFITNPVTMFLGRISYSLYLIHQLLSLEILTYLIKVRGVNFWLAALVALSIALSVASFITIFLEEPIIRWLRNAIFKRKKVNIEQAKINS